MLRGKCEDALLAGGTRIGGGAQVTRYNTMNENQFGNRVRHLLNQGLDIQPHAAEQLRAARERALAAQRPEPIAALAWADNVAGFFGGWAGFSLRLIMPLVLLAVAVVSLYSWQQNRVVAEIEEIDAQLLTDDLPIDAYLDRGFQNFLKTRATSE